MNHFISESLHRFVSPYKRVLSREDKALDKAHLNGPAVEHGNQTWIGRSSDCLGGVCTEDGVALRKKVHTSEGLSGKFLKSSELLSSRFWKIEPLASFLLNSPAGSPPVCWPGLLSSRVYSRGGLASPRSCHR